MNFIWWIVAAGVGALIGFLLSRLLSNQVNRKHQQQWATQLARTEEGKNALEDRLVATLEDHRAQRVETEQARSRSEALNAELSRAETEVLHLKEQLAQQQQATVRLQAQLTKEFEAIALRIFQKNSQEFAASNRVQLGQILDPLKERIKDFETKVERTYQTDAKERVTLKTEIGQLLELNRQLSEDANNLALALKGESKTQGDWGELQLELLLEKAGLEKGIHFETQSAHRDEAGQLKKPDFILHLPDQKHLVIDSKVSLTAYERYFSAADAEKSHWLKLHVESIKNHIKDLGAKNYQALYQINAPDYVLMYLPVEPAFSLALQEEPTLFEFGLARNIVLVTTSTLLATLRTVSFIWRQDNQKKNALEIARQSGALYDKFVGFANDMERIKKGIDQTNQAYDDAMTKLSRGRGNLVNRSESLRKLGAKTNKSLPEGLINDQNLEEEDEG
ncbi:MAG: DNA recombination protein RmuC [Salibacteraceae bacterium]